MLLSTTKLSSGTITSIVFTSIILAVILTFVIIWALWKKNKINGKLDGFMYRTTNYFAGFKRLAKAKLIDNTSKPLLSLYWIVLLSGFISAVLNLAFEISYGFYTMGFIRSLFFLSLILFMICFSYRYAPVAPYYYEYNPNLFFYSAITMFFAIIDFFIGFGGSTFATVRNIFVFIGNALFFGTIFVTRFAKKPFKPRDILVYVGAGILIIMQIVGFGLSSFIDPLNVVYGVFALISGVSLNVLLVYFYDDFNFIKRLFRK